MIILVLALAFGLRLVNLNQSFWLDEAAQVIESTRPLSQQLNISSDFHPPLYHVFLHFWLKLGTTEVLARLPSVAFGVVSIYVLYRIGKILVGHKAALFSALLLSLSGYHIWYSQEARPYILFTLLSLVSTFFLMRKQWIYYTLFALLCMYTLYFAPFLFFGHLIYIFLFEKKSLRLFFCATGTVVIGFQPWLPYFITQLHIGTGGFFAGWTDVVSQPVLKAIPLTFAKFILGKGSIDNNILYLMAVLPVFVIFCFSAGILSVNRQGKKLLVLFFIPFASAALISLFIPVLAAQRLIFLLPFFCLIIAAGIYKFTTAIKYSAIVTVFVAFTASAISYYSNPYIQREQWRQAVKFVENTAYWGSVSLFAFPEPFAPYLWYASTKVPGFGIAKTFAVTEKDLSAVGLLTTAKRVYFFQYLTGLTDPNGITNEYLKKLQFVNTKTVDFPGVGFVYIYDKI